MLAVNGGSVALTTPKPAPELAPENGARRGGANHAHRRRRDQRQALCPLVRRDEREPSTTSPGRYGDFEFWYTRRC